MEVIFAMFAVISGSVSWAAGDPGMIHLREQVTVADSARQLKKSLDREATYLKNLRTCEFELKKEVPPVHCFAVVEIRRKTNVESIHSINLKLRNLNHLCRKYAQKQNNLKLLRSKSQVEGVSSSCRRGIFMKIADLEYQSIDEKPDLQEVVQDLGPVHQLVQ